MRKYSGGERYYVIILIISWSLTLGVLPVRLQSADLEREYWFDTLDSRSGLSQNTVYCLTQDRDDFLWIGTEDGLNRFDGYEYLVIKHEPGMSHSLSDNTVSALLEDADGVLWVGTRGGGLNRLNRNNLHCRHFPDRTSRETSYNFIMTIKQDQQGQIWLGTKGGLSRFNPRTSQFSPILKNCIVWRLAFDADGKLWIGTEKQGLLILKPGETTAEPFRWNNPADKAAVAELNSSWIRALLRDMDGGMWVGTYGAGLYYIDTKHAVIRTFRHDPKNRGAISSNHILSLHQTGGGALWVGTRDTGLNIIERPNFLVTHLPPARTQPGAIQSKALLCFLEDRSGVIFIGSGTSGVHKYSPWRRKFRMLPGVDSQGVSLSSDHIWAICQDRQEQLWLATDNGLERVDLEKKIYRHYSPRPGDSGGLSAAVPRCLLTDRQGAVWVGTLGGGASRWNPRNDTFTQFLHDPHNPHSIGHNNVLRLYQDKSGRIWFGMYNGGVSILEENSLAFTTFRHDPANPNSISDNTASAFLENLNGDIWIGTEYGLNLWEKKENQPVHPGFRHFFSNPANPGAISHNGIKCLHRDSRGKIWIGSECGLNLWNPDSRSFQHFFTADGLPSNTIYAILEDEDHRLWISTNRGISCFNPSMRRFRNYDSDDGLQGDEFNGGAFYQNNQGVMFFGGLYGLNYFHPGQVRDNPYVPLIKFTGFRIFNQPMVKRPFAADNDHLRLSYRDNFITLQFAALDYSNPAKNRFQFMLEGFDRQWLDSGAKRSISYTNLDGGVYRLHVKAGNHDGVWNEKAYILKITVIPPFWETVWFRILFVALAMLIVMGIVALRTHQLRIHRRELSRMVTERTRELEKARDRAEKAVMARSHFLSTMSHEMRTPMNAIIGMTDLTLESHLETSQRQNLNGVKTAAHRMLELIDDILRLTRLESGSLELENKAFMLADPLEQAVRRFQPKALEKGIILNLTLQPGLPRWLWGDPSRLGQVLKNLLHNAVKFTRQGQILLNVESLGLKEPETIIIRFSVTDTGIGVPEHKKEEIFMAFIQADSSDSRPFGGVGIGLALADKLVRLMGGEIRVQSPPEPPLFPGGSPGSCFSFQLSFRFIQPCSPETQLSPAETPRLNSPHPFRPLKIMVAEDNAINRKLVALRLQQLGHSVILTVNGAEVLEKLPHTPCDLILMDIQMPVIDGIETTQRIRNGDIAFANIPIIALTAHNSAEDRRKAASAGMNDFIAKPFRVQHLQNVLQKVTLHW